MVLPVCSFRFFGEVWLSSGFARTEPKSVWNLRFVPAMMVDAIDLSSTGFFGFGPSTPRQDAVPHRHCCMFFCENGLLWLACHALSR